MPSTLEAPVLFESGRYKEALALLRAAEARRPLDVAERVQLAELLWLRGELDLALATAQELVRQKDLSSRLRCSAYRILGQCNFSNGKIQQGAEKCRQGIELAERSNELAEECKLRVQLFINQIHWQGPQAATSGLDTLRRKVHQLGDPSIAITFQLGLTELAAKLALLPRARKHLEIARALLPKVRNRAAETRFKHTAIALASEEGDWAQALREGLELGEDKDLDLTRTNLLITLGHLLIVQARFAEAERWLERAFTITATYTAAEIALRDTMMLLKLTQGKLDEAGTWDASIHRLLNETELADSYFGLWHLVTHIKWLYQLGRVGEGVAIAVEATPRVETMADRNLVARVKLLLAEGLGLTSRPTEGARAVTEVLESNPEPSLEMLAEAFRVMGSLVAHTDTEAAKEHYKRAEDILRALGNIAGATAVAREREVRIPMNASNGCLLLTGNDDAALWSTRFAALLEVAASPAVLASQTLSLISHTGAACSAALFKSDSAGRSHLIEECHLSDNDTQAQPTLKDSVCIKLGMHRDHSYEIRVVPNSKPTSQQALLSVKRVVLNAVALSQSRLAERERAALWPVQSAESQLGLICSSERMLELVKTIHRVAASNVTVLLTGETGVGKELFARALHQASVRSNQVFLPYNCSTVPREMLDSQLFGHRRGAFTGAEHDSAGIIRSAVGGTLFLDEIGEMPLETQPKLLRFLESGEVLPLGEAKPQLVDVRIVAATNANLDQAVADGRFREDLYYRLNVIRIHIPPLRERREEIPALVEHFLEKFGRELHKPMLRVADETLEYLVLYRWPGNVRQLANELRRMVAMAEAGAVLMPAHLSDDIAASRRTVPVNTSPRLFNEVVTRIDQPLAAAVEHIERATIQRALSMTDGRLDEAAKMLGVSRKGLYLKRQRLNLG